MSADLTPLPPHKVIARNGLGWGVGVGIAEATKNCKKCTGKKPTSFGLIPKDATVNDFTIGYPPGSFYEVNIT